MNPVSNLSIYTAIRSNPESGLYEADITAVKFGCMLKAHRTIRHWNLFHLLIHSSGIAKCLLMDRSVGPDYYTMDGLTTVRLHMKVRPGSEAKPMLVEGIPLDEPQIRFTRNATSARETLARFVEDIAAYLEPRLHRPETPIEGPSLGATSSLAPVNVAWEIHRYAEVCVSVVENLALGEERWWEHENPLEAVDDSYFDVIWAARGRSFEIDRYPPSADWIVSCSTQQLLTEPCLACDSDGDHFFHHTCEERLAEGYCVFIQPPHGKSVEWSGRGFTVADALTNALSAIDAESVLG